MEALEAVNTIVPVPTRYSGTKDSSAVAYYAFTRSATVVEYDGVVANHDSTETRQDGQGQDVQDFAVRLCSCHLLVILSHGQFKTFWDLFVLCVLFVT